MLLLLALAALLPGVAQAQLPPRERAISVSLLPAAGQVPAGESVPLAVVMRPRPGWHGYWQNPGDAGAGARIQWELPAGVTAGPLRYPVPDRLIIAGLMNYVYEREYALLTELRLPAALAPGTRLPVRAKLDYLACTDEICVPESATVSTELEVGSGGGPDNRALLARYARALPRPLAREASFEVAGDRLRLAVPLPASLAVTDPYFYPATEGTLDYSAVQAFAREGDLLIIEAPAEKGAASLRSIEGVLEYADGQGLAITARPGPVPAAAIPVARMEEARVSRADLLPAFFAALLGGLILNIMPCVFPILSLKALSLAKTGGDERAAKREALAYSTGAIVTCLALGAVLLALRAGGETVGWAFQLQDPRVILFLLLLVTAIALNLAGLFDLPALGLGERLTRTGGRSGAFWTGALAAFVATPCTGPFMGLALGAALVLPAAAALAVFAGLGLGLALPFLALGFIPSLRRRLPKPGPWMGRFRRILSVPMFLTALGLAWILWRQSGDIGLALGIGAAVVLGFGLWMAARGRAWLTLAPAAVAALAAIILVPTSLAPASARSDGILPAEAFSEARLAELRAQGRPVFVYFTADWCITCKVNERAVLGRDEVAERFASRNVAVLVGDWTRGDPEIGRFLASHGRSGVPLYLYYAPGGDPDILPQVLTSKRLTGLG